MNKITYIETFAGIGGFRIGIDNASKLLGIPTKCLLAIEFDKDAQHTYYNNFDDYPLGDITKVDPIILPDHDLLVGGFPCQTFSRNGKYYNKNNRTLGDDDRANLFLNLVDILNEKKPKMFLFENVKGLLSMKNQDGSSFLDTLMTNLTDSGYKVTYKVLSPHEFGVPQQRYRVFFVGIRNDLDLTFEFPKPNGLVGSVQEIEELNADPSLLLENLWKNRVNKINGMPRLDSLREAYSSGKWVLPSCPTNEIEPVGIIYGDTPSGLPRQQDKLYSKLGIAPTIATFATPSFDFDSGWRQLSPRECARLQSFPDTFKLHKNSALAYKQVGNAVNTFVIQKLAENILTLLNK